MRYDVYNWYNNLSIKKHMIKISKWDKFYPN